MKGDSLQILAGSCRTCRVSARELDKLPVCVTSIGSCTYDGSGGGYDAARSGLRSGGPGGAGEGGLSAVDLDGLPQPEVATGAEGAVDVDRRCAESNGIVTGGGPKSDRALGNVDPHQSAANYGAGRSRGSGLAARGLGAD